MNATDLESLSIVNATCLVYRSKQARLKCFIVVYFGNVHPGDKLEIVSEQLSEICLPLLDWRPVKQAACGKAVVNIEAYIVGVVDRYEW